MNNDIVWFIVVGRNVLSLDEVKRSFESGECDLYHVIEETYGQHKKHSYTLVKVKDNTEEGKAHKEQCRKLTSLRLSREK